LYASHVVEHFDYRQELPRVLAEWWRVLAPGGTLYVAVPDLDVLAQAILSPKKLSVGDRFYAMQMLFGGHVDDYDYHKVGLNQEFLGAFLTRAGFLRLRRVAGFGLFQDTSLMRLGTVPISLNVIAEKPRPGEPLPPGAEAGTDA